MIDGLLAEAVEYALAYSEWYAGTRKSRPQRKNLHDDVKRSTERWVEELLLHVEDQTNQKEESCPA